MEIDSAIVIAEVAAAEKNFFGRVRKHQAPQPRRNADLYFCARHSDGSRELRPVSTGALNAGLPIDGNTVFYHVSVFPHPICLSFSEAFTDATGHAWDCCINGYASVVDSQQFLDQWAMGIARVGMPVSEAMLQSWLAHTVDSRIPGWVKDCKWNDPNNRDAIAPALWERQFSSWLGNYGVSIRVEKVSWASPQNEAAETEAVRRRDFERIEQARQCARDAELAEAAARADHENRIAKIQNDRRLSEEERMNQHQLLEMEYQTNLIRAKTEMENAQRDAEKAAWEHETALARERNDVQFAKHAEESECEAENRHKVVLQELERMRADLAAIAALPGNLLAQLADRDAEKANAAAERLVSPEFNLSPGVLARLGYRVDQQGLMDFLRKKAFSDGEPIDVWKTQLLTRTIGTAKVKALAVNTSLQFEFSTKRDGYVTLVNIGTSGEVYIHIPNAYVGDQAAKAEEGRTYSVPGPELLPWESLRRHTLDYVEVGPPGWEHIVVLISKQPLLKAETLARARGSSPLVKLKVDEIADMCEHLSEQPDDQWTAGVLSFLVE